MSKFKIGDVIKCIDAGGHASHITKGEDYVVVEVHNDISMLERDDGTIAGYCDWRFEVVVDERQALSDAIALVQEHKVGVNVSDSRVWYGPFKRGMCMPVVEMLDEIFPTKTADQLEIEEVEGKLRVLADQLAKLKDK
jgi:hypothetical protein